MKISKTTPGYFCKADAISANPLEMYSVENQKSRLKISASLDLTRAVKDMMDDVPGWLPIAAEAMGISANLKDYILTPVVSMPSDLPNRNGQAFPYTELSAWNPVHGSIMYKTWRGKGIFIEHSSEDYTQAKGIIFATMLLPIANTVGNIWKVIKLNGVDRNRDSVLANEILTKKAKHWSMGAYAEDYSCSICGHNFSNGDCEHNEASNDKPPKFKIFNNHLAYWNVEKPVGFECSVVAAPAYSSAEDTNYFTFKD
jgi:hypothetical protein